MEGTAPARPATHLQGACAYEKLVDVALCFLSYAQADTNPYFEKFLESFMGELRDEIGADPSEELVFRDSDSIRLGARWELKLEHALLSSRIFIAMLSPTYIQRPACGREWAAFEWRLQHARGGAAAPDLLLPLLWIPIPNADLPPVVRARQFAHSSLGSAYKEHGLKDLVRRGRHKNLVAALARHVSELVRQPLLPSPSPLPPPGELPVTFGSAKPAPAPPVTPAAAVPVGGPKRVEFIVVAAHAGEIAAVRKDVASYGGEYDEWRPYLPEQGDDVGFLIQEIAHGEKLRFGISPVPQDIVAHVQEALAKNKMVVLVVDVWSLRLDAYQSRMKRFDTAERLINAGVLVVWNLADDQTRDNAHELDKAVRQAFQRLTIVGDGPAFHQQLGTPGELAEKLRATLHELRRRITLYGEVHRKAEGDTAIPKPLLAAPGAL